MGIWNRWHRPTPRGLSHEEFIVQRDAKLRRGDRLLWAALAVLVLVLAIGPGRSDIAIASHRAEASATVRDFDGPTARTVSAGRVLVEFSARGNLRRQWLELPVWADSPSIGDRVRVVYSVADPQRARLAGALAIFADGGAVLLGILLFGLALLPRAALALERLAVRLSRRIGGGHRRPQGRHT